MVLNGGRGLVTTSFARFGFTDYLLLCAADDAFGSFPCSLSRSMIFEVTSVKSLTKRDIGVGLLLIISLLRTERWNTINLEVTMRSISRKLYERVLWELK